MANFLIYGVQWHEGMLLLPQHFQQADLRTEQLLHFHLSQIAPFYWGVANYEIDEARLINGLLVVLKLNAIFPDGLAISHQYDFGGLELDLTPHMEQIEKDPQMVYLTAPLFQQSGPNAVGEQSRYLSKEFEMAVDQNTGQGGLAIPRMVPNVKLMIGDVPDTQLVNFPLFRISLNNNAYVLEDYYPPQLKVSMDSPLGQALRQISKRMREKIAVLSQQIQVGQGTAEVETIVRALAAGLIPFEAQLYSNSAHPYSLYLQLCALAGQVLGVHPGYMPPVLEPYNHNDILKSYHAVMDVIDDLLDKVQEGYQQIPLKIEEQKFVLPEWPAHMSEIILGVKSPPTASPHDITRWIEGAVIVSKSYIQQAMADRIRGAPRTVVMRPDEVGIYPPKGTILVKVMQDIDTVRPAEPLVIFNTLDTEQTRPLDIIIYIPKLAKE